MREFRRLLLMGGIALCIFAKPSRAEDGDGWLRFDEGWWRLEFAGAPWIRGSPDHDGDFYMLGAAEYEFEAFRRSTFGLRMIPAFYYHEDEDADGERNSIFGAGGGLRYRMYWEAEKRSGVFLEAGVSALLHTPKFEGNSNSVNFLSEGGIGYQFRESPWNLGIRYTHTSNASLGSENSDMSGLLFSVGYRF